MNVQVREFAAASGVQRLHAIMRTPTTSTCSISGVENLKSEGGENGKR
jgi:hypothetical protein